MDKDILDFGSDKTLNYSNRKMFTKDTIKHPAKADLSMLKWIIKTYTKERDTILDPMAGTGSTGVIAMLHNRNCIMVEYEEKFCKVARKNIELNRKPRLLPMGHVEIIQGDARFLNRIFKDKADGVVMSPPYAETEKRDRSKEDWWDEDRERKHSGGTIKISKGYQADKSNIGNLPFKADSIITSPPYQHGGSVYSTLKPEIVEKNPNMRGRKAYTTEQAEPYSTNPDNIGNLKNQSYLEAMKMVYQGCYEVLKPNGTMVLITKNFIRNKKIVPLDQHTIKLCQSVGFKFIKRHYRKIINPSFWRILYKKKYGLEIPYEDILIFKKESR